MKVKKLIAMALAAGMTVSVLAACGQKPGDDSENTGSGSQAEQSASGDEKKEEPVTINYLTSSMDFAKASDEINAELQKVYPYLTVNIEHIADNYEAVLKTKLQTDSAPDIFSGQGYVAMRPYVEAGHVEDLSNSGLKECLLENYVEAGTMDGKLYGIPTMTQTFGLLYNKDALASAGVNEPPKTVSELKDAIEKLKAAGIQPFASGLKEQWVCYQWFWYAQSPVLEDMSAWYDSMNAGEGTFKNDKTEDIFALYDLIFQNCGDKPLSSDFTEMCHKLGTGEAAMALEGDWSYPETVKVNPEANIGMAGFPIDENPDNATVLTDVAEVLFVSSQSKHKDAAIDFLKWVLSKEGAECMSSISKAASPSNANPEIELSDFAADGNQWINDGKKTAPFSWSYWTSGIMDLAGKDLQAYFSGTMTLDEMMDDLDAQWTKSNQ